MKVETFPACALRVLIFLHTSQSGEAASLFTQKWKITDFSLSFVHALSRFLPSPTQRRHHFQAILPPMQLCSEVFPARSFCSCVGCTFSFLRKFSFHVMMFSGVRCNKNGNFCIARRQRKVFARWWMHLVGAEAAAAAFPVPRSCRKLTGKLLIRPRRRIAVASKLTDAWTKGNSCAA